MAVQSLRARFFRSAITTMSLILAVAFLAYTWVGNDIMQSLLNTADKTIMQKLQVMGYDISSSVSASPKQRWIVFLSLLVCVVGIINAQLMSVTERFREIGTLKCLGALDSFVIRLFVLEALIQGLIGSILGVLFGVGFAIFSAFLRFGTSSISHIGFPVFYSAMLAIIIGTSLSLIGALYPAIIAARMQPVEAMRAEQ
ncbi:MAG: FtsX-like permease family protein [Desulfotalea sp.]